MSESTKAQNDSSLEIFRSFMLRKGNGEIDCKAVLSRDCYDYWLSQRKIVAVSPEEAFRKVLTAHVRGNWGRKPFTEEEESAVLKELRQKKIWPCFQGTKLRIGINGFRALGYHEQIRKHGKVVGKVKKEEKTKEEKSKKFLSSFEVFIKFGKAVDGESKILSRECFNTWVSTRRNGCKKPEFSFRKALIAHLTGKDGRRPFTEDIERDVLKVLRKQETWPCFAQCKEKQYRSIGKKGCKQLGYHELQQQSTTEECMNKRPTSIDHSISFKKRRVDFPMIYFNCMNDQNKVDDVLHYDPFQGDLSSFDMESDGLVNEKLSANECSIEQKIMIDELFGSESSMSVFSIEAEENKCYMSDYREPRSILETFEDVTSEEVEKVILLRNLTKPLFDNYLNKVENPCEKFCPSDMCGDVRLLRYLRVSRHNIHNTVKEIECCLEWRLYWKVDAIRRELLENNLSIKELRKSLSIGLKGGCYPFFSQHENGDITDIFVMQEQEEASFEQSKEDYLSHVKLNEFRSIVLDRLSLIKRRMVGCKLILDCNKVRSGGEANWWSTVRNYSWYLKEMSYLHSRYYGGFFGKIHVFGQGYVFKVLFNSIGKSLFDSLLGNTDSSYGSPIDHTEVLYKMLGESSKWPKFYGGHVEEADNTDLANKTISKF